MKILIAFVACFFIGYFWMEYCLKNIVPPKEETHVAEYHILPAEVMDPMETLTLRQYFTGDSVACYNSFLWEKEKLHKALKNDTYFQAEFK